MSDPDGDALFSTLDLDPVAERPGYRLHRLELLNWGTFHAHPEVLRLSGDNTLVTGDIGSGKSTLVDAVTTLLLPANRINYNKAAGADTRERSLRSYVLGHYRSERVESTGSARAVGLRDQNSYSVVLGVFRNEGFDTAVTLAQVFWMPGSTEQQPRRFFVTSSEDLSIAADFTDFGSDPAGLKRRLRARGASVSDHFPEYGNRLRRRLDIASDQALDLFHQTISMKSVGNLTEFVRQHMLEGADTSARIASLVQHFEDLSRAHDAVRRARDQLAHLGPIVTACDEHDARAARIVRGTTARQALPLWIAEHRLRLLDAERARVTAEQQEVEAVHAAAEARLQQLADERAGLVQAREGVAGGRLAAIEAELRAAAERRDERRALAARHAALLREADLPPVEDAAAFAAVRDAVRSRQEQDDAEGRATTERIADLAAERREVERDSQAIRAELASLHGRQSNIDVRSLELRDRIAAALGIEADRLPFVGELIAVREEHAAWRGAAERVLRAFALSVLVPPDLYPQVAGWVDAEHLGARLVYFRAGDVVRRSTARSGGGAGADVVLADLLEIRQGPYAAWIGEELRGRADHVCVAATGAFTQHRRAVTRQGQIKADRRHEKDDRFALGDRTRWVLGWSNAEKVQALLDRAAATTERLAALQSALERAQDDAERRVVRAGVRAQVLAVEQWDRLDWRTVAARIAALDAERERLERGNRELAALQVRLAAVEAELDGARGEAGTLGRRLGALEQRTADLAADADRTDRLLAAPAPTGLERLRAAYPDLAELGAPPTGLDACAGVEADHRDRINRAIEDDQLRQRRAGERATRLIGEFRRAWPAEVTELGADVQAADEYRQLRERIAGDDLPRFEVEFKRQLNTNTINDIAGFQAWLDQSAQTIRQRIATINTSLGAIDYNPGTRITLLTEPTSNQEVKAFRDDLRACTDDALSTDEQYSEERFRRVKAIIERFRGREGFTDADRRWTETVTDVRSWFVFAASERDRDSGAEREHYTDSDGKSGGQKEKLAYTILAASLAYQFGLEWGVQKSRDFRFVVIDEAFGRGSDASTRYALDLFARLGLQLLVVTPLQKVQVIEPYVRAVGFVENRSGGRSRLHTLTIEEYRAERAERARLAVAADRG